MAKVSQLIQNKGDVWSVTPQDSVYDAIKLMDEKGIGAVAVMVDAALVGIFSERDYARKVILKERSSKTTSVEEIMTRNVYYVSPEQDTNACMIIMTKHHIRHLPVLYDDRVIGMITLGDVVQAIIAEQQLQIEHLENVISWSESY